MQVCVGKGEKILMIYTNKASFKPLMIILSFLFIPSIVTLIVCCFLIPSIPIYVILLVFILMYCLGIIAIRKESNSHRNYIKIMEDMIILKFDNFSSNEISIKYVDIYQIDYYRINSFISWFALICMQCPKIAFLTFSDGKSIMKKPIGYFEKKDIEKICNINKIKLVIH